MHFQNYLTFWILQILWILLIPQTSKPPGPLYPPDPLDPPDLPDLPEPQDLPEPHPLGLLTHQNLLILLFLWGIWLKYSHAALKNTAHARYYPPKINSEALFEDFGIVFKQFANFIIRIEKLIR